MPNFFEGLLGCKLATKFVYDKFRDSQKLMFGTKIFAETVMDMLSMTMLFVLGRKSTSTILLLEESRLIGL